MTKAVIIASERGEIALAGAIEQLRAGASALDVVEQAIRVVEANEQDHYVGVGGLPNLFGEVELDASIMDARTRKAGAVAGVRGFPHPISIARAVMERLPQHVLLVGDGAERFADECEIPRGETLTDEAKRLWWEGLQPEGLAEAKSAGEVKYRQAALATIKAMGPPEGPYGTVNIIALDQAGDLVVGVSTSGYPWKYPGRAGDSPLIGAGNYCDLRYGGAACTGRGELAIRGATARTVVSGLAAGQDPVAACAAALRDTLILEDEFQAPLQALCLTPDGRHGGAATREGGTYAVMDEDDQEYRIIEREQV